MINKNIVLCEILEIPETSSRKVGTQMAVYEDGTALGTIGGGELELNTLKFAREVFQEKQTIIKTIASCGGNVKVQIQYLSPDVKEDCDKIKEFFKKANRVWIFGGGNVGRALVPVLSSIDFEVNVFDNRPECAQRERFPQAKEVVCGDFCKIDDYIKLNKNDYVIVMTPNHQHDYEVLEQTLRMTEAYWGCIGSRKKAAAITERLIAAGYSLKTIEKVHMPIGIKLMASTPEEIAISIAAELINYRSNFKPM